MNEPKLVESQLHCRANASLNSSIIEDLQKEDRPLDALLEENKDINEKDSNDAPRNSPK